MGRGRRGEERLNAAIRELLESRETGVEPDRENWLGRYPDLAPELTAFLETDDQVQWVINTAVASQPASGVRFGPYRIVRVVGKGGMGVVYEVEESVTGRRLALKVLPTCGLPDPEARTRFRREAEALTHLNHPSIVPILACPEIGGIPAIVMPLILGHDLRSIRRGLERARKPALTETGGTTLSQPEPFVVTHPDRPEERAELGGSGSDWRAIALIGLQAARAPAHAHTRGILHRDVKPSNLVLDDRGTVMLTDFGLADPGGPNQPDLTATGDVVGTLRYLAPERLHGWRDPRSDLYSLGLTLYELMVALPVFALLDRSQILRAIEQDSPPRPRKLNREIPRDLETIVLKATFKEPADRYHSAAAPASDLSRFLEGRPIVARQQGVIRHTCKWIRRHPATSIAIGVFSLILSVGILLAFAYERKRREAVEVARRSTGPSAMPPWRGFG